MFIHDLEQYTILGVQIINFTDIGFLSLRLVLDVISAFITLRFIFYQIYKERDYFFTSFMINIAVFLVCFLMASVKLKIGFAFGLFAVFSILRYRTEKIPIRQMTYMFTAIIIAVLNSMADDKISHVELILANLFIVGTIFILEKDILHNRDFVHEIKYEKIDLIKHENYDLLIKDLKERTGFNVKKAEIQSINFMNDTAKLKVFYQYPNDAPFNHDEECN
jgi:hypothetical protein